MHSTQPPISCPSNSLSPKLFISTQHCILSTTDCRLSLLQTAAQSSDEEEMYVPQAETQAAAISADAEISNAQVNCCVKHV